MEWCEGYFGNSGLLDTAKEELLMLEEEEPNKHRFLKAELKSFISLLEEERGSFSCPSYVATQASSNNVKNNSKKRKKSMDCGEKQALAKKELNAKIQKRGAMKKDRVDIVLDRARLCLQKIREVKASLCL